MWQILSGFLGFTDGVKSWGSSLLLVVLGSMLLLQSCQLADLKSENVELSTGLAEAAQINFSLTNTLLRLEEKHQINLAILAVRDQKTYAILKEKEAVQKQIVKLKKEEANGFALWANYPLPAHVHGLLQSSDSYGVQSDLP